MGVVGGRRRFVMIFSPVLTKLSKLEPHNLDYSPCYLQLNYIVTVSQ